MGRQSERQHRVPADVRRPGRDRRGLRVGEARGEAAGREQPPVPGLDGAARRDRRLQRGRGLLHALHRVAEPARRAHGDLPYLPRAGEPDPGGVAGRRRRLRAQGRHVPRRCPGDVGVAPAAAPGEMGREPRRKHADRPSWPRDGLLRRARARRERQDRRAAQQEPVPDGRLFRQCRARRRRLLAALRAAGLRHPDHAHHVARPVHQHVAERALSRRRPARGRLFHGAPDRARRPRDRHGRGGNPPPQSHSDGEAALHDAHSLGLRQRRVHPPDGPLHRARRPRRVSRRARRRRKSAASCAAAR